MMSHIPSESLVTQMNKTATTVAFFNSSKTFKQDQLRKKVYPLSIGLTMYVDLHMAQKVGGGFQDDEQQE